MAKRLNQNWMKLNDLAKVLGIGKEELRRVHNKLGQPFETRDGDSKTAAVLVDSPRWLQAWALSQKPVDVAGDPLMAGDNSPHLERYRSYRADCEKIKRDQLLGKLVPIEEARVIVETVGSHIRRGTERMCHPCRDILSESLAESEAALAEAEDSHARYRGEVAEA